MRLFSPAKGRKPKPWDHELKNPYTEKGLPDPIQREDQLHTRLASMQRLLWGALVVIALIGAHSWQLGQKVQEKIVPWIVEVEKGGPVRSVGILPQQPYTQPAPNTLIYVLRMWIWYVRTVGDSKVLLGQAWEMAKAFTDPALHPWLHEQIQERYTQMFQKHYVVQVTKPVILPQDEKARTFKAEWEEVTYGPTGDVLKHARWLATFTLKVAPPPSLQTQQDWKNDLGILVTEVHWLEQAVTTKGSQP